MRLFYEVKVTNQLRTGIDKEGARDSLREPGSGKKSMVGTISESVKSLVFPVTGTESVSPWMRAASRWYFVGFAQ